MKKLYYEVDNKHNEASIFIYGVIGLNEEYYDGGTNNKGHKVVNLINKLSKEHKRLNIHILSPGGSIDDGLAIFNTLKKCNADVHTYSDGFVGSMASIIMLAGKTHLPTTSIFHLHSALSITFGNINDHKQTIHMLESYETVLQQTIADKTGLSIDEIKKNWFDGKDHFLTATEANDYGFVDYLEDGDVPKMNSIDELKAMNYSDFMRTFSYKSPDKGFLTKLKSAFTSTTHDINLKKETMGKKQLQSGLYFILALFDTEGFEMNADGNIEMSVNDIFDIENELKELNSTKEQLTSNLAAKEAELQELKTKLSNAPIEPPAGNKKLDNSKPDVSDTEISDDVSRQLFEYNQNRN